MSLQLIHHIEFGTSRWQPAHLDMQLMGQAASCLGTLSRMPIQKQNNLPAKPMDSDSTPDHLRIGLTISG
jgi:hypothetical protein